MGDLVGHSWSGLSKRDVDGGTCCQWQSNQIKMGPSDGMSGPDHVIITGEAQKQGIDVT